MVRRTSFVTSLSFLIHWDNSTAVASLVSGFSTVAHKQAVCKVIVSQRDYP